MTRRLLRPLVGLVSIVLVVSAFVVAANLFRGGYADTASVTVISERAGLVMNPDAKVQVRGVQVGRVASIEALPNGQAAIHLAMDRSRLNAIPANALVDIASPTVFGAKQVQFVFPENPSPESLRAGQVIDAQHVMVEVNTVFEQLTSVLSTIEPAKLNETLGALASALSGRGEKIRSDARRSGFVSRHARTEPSGSEPRSGGRAWRTACVRRRVAPISSRSPTTQRGSATRSSTSNRTSMRRSSA